VPGKGRLDRCTCVAYGLLVSARRVKVMADYYAFPLWPEAGLLLSDELRRQLEQWGGDYTDTLRSNGYAWPNTTVQTDWNERGRRLAARVQHELGTDYEVVFFDEVTQTTEPVQPS